MTVPTSQMQPPGLSRVTRLQAPPMAQGCTLPSIPVLTLLLSRVLRSRALSYTEARTFSGYRGLGLLIFASSLFSFFTLEEKFAAHQEVPGKRFCV